MQERYQPLFTPWKIGNVEIKNRIVMLPMEGTNMIQWEVKRGFVKGIDKFYEDRAGKDIGLFIPGLIPLVQHDPAVQRDVGTEVRDDVQPQHIMVESLAPIHVLDRN